MEWIERRLGEPNSNSENAVRNSSLKNAPGVKEEPFLLKSALLKINSDTLRKALNDGRLTPVTRSTDTSGERASTQSERTQTDARAGEQIGVGATNSPDRAAAAMGLINGVKSHFQACLDVPMVGVLCALPSVLANGLLSGIDKLGKLPQETIERLTN